MGLFRKKKHRKYMELLGNMRKVSSMKDTIDCIQADDDYKSGLSDGLEWALAILQNRDTDLSFRIEKSPACTGRTGNIDNKTITV